MPQQTLLFSSSNSNMLKEVLSSLHKLNTAQDLPMERKDAINKSVLALFDMI